MRKTNVLKVVFATGVFCFCTGAFAVQTSSINYTMGGQSYNITSASSTSALTVSDAKFKWAFSPFGIEVDNVWSHVTDGGVFEPGFDLDFAANFSGSPTVNGTKLSDFFTIGEFISFSPSFAFNFNEKNTLRFVPGLQFNFNESFYTGSSSVSETLVDFYLALSLKAAYHLWFNSGIGLNFGFDFDIPLIGILNDSGYYYYGNKRYSFSDSFTASGGSDFRFFFGVTFRKGASND